MRLFLSILGVLLLFAAVAVASSAKSVLHEIFGGTIGIMGMIALAGGAILDEIKHQGDTLLKEMIRNRIVTQDIREKGKH